MKVVYVSQPYDLLFPPVQNSIGLIVYHTAVRLSREVAIRVYGRHYSDDPVPDDLAFRVRRLPVLGDRLVRKLARSFPRPSRWLGLDRRADDHAQYRAKVRRCLAEDRPDIVHVMNYWSWCRALKGDGRRLVLEMQCEWLSQRDRRQVARQLEAVDAVVAVSDHIATTFRAAFPDYPGMVATVGNGVDVTVFTPLETPVPARDQRRRILFVGRISPEKGLHTLIEAFAEVARQVGDVELAIAGPQAALSPDFLTSLSPDPRVSALLRFYDDRGTCTYKRDLERLVEREGLGDRVRFLGNVTHADLVAMYQAVDVVVNPSLSESFGISVVEGMACGVPVVGTRIGGMCESIAHGSTGILVEAEAPDELARALVSVLGDPARAAAMGRAGRKRAVELYSWEARARRLLAVYEALTAQAEPPESAAQPGEARRAAR